MVKFGRVELLSHPVCLTFLRMKWQTYGFLYHCINMLMYLIFVCCLTSTIAYLDPRYVAYGGDMRLMNNHSQSSYTDDEMEAMPWMVFFVCSKKIYNMICITVIRNTKCIHLYTDDHRRRNVGDEYD
jgi:hypothetical protein